MTEYPNLTKCQTYIDCHLHAPKSVPALDDRRPPSITISRETGAGGFAIAEMLATLLQSGPLRTDCPWTVFDKNLVNKVLEDHNLPERLAQYMPEDKISFLSDALEELLGLHPPSWELLRQTADTVLHLAELGNVILLGRGANVITAKLDHVFHIRLVGSTARRCARIESALQLSHSAAMDFIRREDAGRTRYLKEHFRCDPADPLLYHLILNTDRLAEQAAAEIIANAVVAKFATPAPITAL